MKKSEIIIIITVAVLIISAVVIGIPAVRGLKSDVKEAVDDIPSEVEHFDTEEDYVKRVTDSRGLVIREDFYEYEGGEKTGSNVFTYDKNGNVIKIENYGPDPDDEYAFVITVTYEYDENNNQTEEKSVMSSVLGDGVVYHKKYTYDENNHLERTDFMDTANGGIESYYLHKCDDKGNVSETYDYTKDGKLERFCKFQYNENGQRIREELYKADGTFDYYITFEYNEEGELITRKTFR